MSLRAKLLLIFILLGLVPMFLLGIINYLSGARAVEKLLREETETRAGDVAREVETAIRGHEARLFVWANSPAVRAYLIQRSAPVPDEVRDDVSRLLLNNQTHLESLVLLDGEGRPRLRADLARQVDGRAEARFATEDIPSSLVRADNRVWEATGVEGALRSPVTYEPYGACVRLTLPIRPDGEGRMGRAAGALVAEMKLGALFEEAGASSPAAREQFIVALDNPTGRIIYHTGGTFRTQTADIALPFFRDVAGRMRAGARAGSDFYDGPDGARWLASFEQVEGAGASVAAARNYSAAVAGVNRAGLVGLALPLVAGLAALWLLWLVAGRATRRIERVAAGAAAIAGGDLNQRIDLDASGETRALAESFNLMSDRLREHIARETETRQFESFMRLSAMLTHDLKNSITGLSMLVNNMEKQFHVAEFRADAVASLREATDKLRRIVARLSEPVKSLSGEYRSSARETDLVAVIRRVISVNAEPSRPLYEIETRLPDKLEAMVDAGRIENVVENLVINALEAMGADGGRLTVEAGALEDGHVFFSVADTGRGMTPEFVRTRLFRPFTTTKTKGIGLGLFTCREIVETHGGRLEVESQTGVGTRFRVVLPSSLFQTRARQRQPQKGAVAASNSPERGA